MDSDSDKSKEMKELFQKEKELYNKIHNDYKKFSEKIDDDFEKIKQSKAQE